MSHEIRTPLNGVLGVLQLLKKEELSAEGGKRLAVATQSGKHLATLINQVLDFARIEAGEVEHARDAFRLGALVDGVGSAFTFEAEAKGLSLHTHTVGLDEKPLLGDHHQIRQVLFNLVGNAIKFTNEGAVVIRASEERLAHGRVRVVVSVSDTGVGIAEADRAIIFQEFGQALAGNGRGTGLGLAISKRLIESMGGELTVESAVNVGSTFRLTVDLERCEDPAPTANRVGSADRGRLRSARILLVEDNPVNQMVARALLEEDGHTVTVVANGKAAVDAVAADASAFDVILMDIQMPVMDGVQAAKEIRCIEPDLERLPIVALTANAFEDQRRAYLEAGMNAVVTKPLRTEDIDDVFRKLGLIDLPSRAAPAPSEGAPLADLEGVREFRRRMGVGTFNSLLAACEADIERLAREMLADDLAADRRKSLAHEWKGLLANFGLAAAAAEAGRMEAAETIDAPDLTAKVGRIRELANAGLQQVKAASEA